MKTTNNLKINACSGGIYKTCKESWFVRFHLQSGYAEKLLVSNPNIWLETEEKHITVIVLQMVICGEMEVIAELIKKEDYDKYFENNEVENE
jgi:hypothetical protein